MQSIKTFSSGILALGILLSSTSLLASSMIVIDESTEVDSVVNSIELPPPAQKQAHEASSTGREQAKQAREAGRELGQEQVNSTRDTAPEVQDRQLQRQTPEEHQTPRP